MIQGIDPYEYVAGYMNAKYVSDIRKAVSRADINKAISEYAEKDNFSKGYWDELIDYFVC